MTANTNATRISRSGAKCLKVLFALSGHSLTGLSNTELSKALGESPATINRCLNTLVAEGAVIKLVTGRYAPGIRILQIAVRHHREFSNMRDRMDEIDQRVLAGANL
ncbi:helix-turn-helix domain-containing protein [Marinobacter shengliensis]|uniref:helix-turn-helix domain-containing protein n=1 Tax=Marinobacter shengliensis TaxID=1389223 RepID=UPI002573756E|nr:helix-turn-helix domain-containing protein [Marinobacter shengliensis]BEH14284.1 IclR family transcriptional regulator [Marinobacter shengliensis]